MRQALHLEPLATLRATAMAAVVVVGVSACEGLNPTPGPTVFAGVLAGASESGSLTFEGGTAALVATLTLVAPSGGTHTLSGAYDPISRQISAAGDGYTLDGTSTSGAITGSYKGPNGSGAFSLQAPAPKASVRSFCGSYSTPGASGVLNLVVNLSTVTGLAVSSAGHVALLTGTYSAGAITIQNPDNSAATLATGTLNGTTISGPYDDGKGSQGTWKSTTC